MGFWGFGEQYVTERSTLEILTYCCEYNKRGKKDFPFLAHSVRGELCRQARVSSILHHALHVHPELCSTEPAESLEALHTALVRFVKHTCSPHVSRGRGRRSSMLSHGGNAMLNVRGRLDGPAAPGVGSSRDEQYVTEPVH